MRDSNVGKVRVDGFYDLVIVVPELLKLEIKVVQPGDELHLRRVAFDDDELLVEDSFDDKPAAVMLQSCLTKHLLKADILFRGEFEIIPVDSGICRCRASDPLFRGCHQSGSLSGVTRERHPASQSEHLSYAEKLFGIQRYSSLLSGDNKNPRRRIFERSFENPPLRLLGWVCSQCNITTVSGQKKAIGADWSGLERTSEPKRFTLLYIAAGLIIRATTRIAK